MARTTRSAVVHQEKEKEDNEKVDGNAPNANKARALVKKRKRTSGLDSDDLPSAKYARSDDEEANAKDDDGLGAGLPPLAGDSSIKEDDAQKILDILEMIDTQGLLDRVFPLDDVLDAIAPPTPSSSKTPSDSYSLRALLKEPSDHPLRVYRSAIKQLFPISSLPRSRISPPAAQQLRFCELALSLVEQASANTVDVLSLQPELVKTDPKAENDASPVKEEPGLSGKRRKYALVQKLPNGEWWTSLSADLPGADAKPLKDLNTAHAELVAILPSPSSSTKPPPTLGELHGGKRVFARVKPVGPRLISSGTFLDYGPFASFAPSFDSEGACIGRAGVSSVLWARHEKGKMRERARILGERMRMKLATRALDSMEVDGVEEVVTDEEKTIARQQQKDRLNELMRLFFTPEETKSLMECLDTIEMEEDVSELLQRNAKALLRLQELQAQRLGGEKGGSSTVQVGSEEWDIAQKITESLTLLASLRPRQSLAASSAIIPPASTLRALQSALPTGSSPGWYGTLAESRGAALHDDSTIHLKATIPAQTLAAAPKPAVVAAPAAQASTPAYSPAPNYSQQGYAYQNYPQQYRTTYAQYGTSGQPTNGYYTSTYMQGAGTGVTTSTQPSTTQSYSTYGNSSQYPYSTWYSNYQPQAAATPGSASRRGTPQPATATTASGLAATYAPYGIGGTSATPTRAVANTIVAKPQINGWATPNATAYAAPTLPAHLRPAGTTTPAMASTPLGSYSQNYLSSHQSTPPASS